MRLRPLLLASLAALAGCATTAPVAEPDVGVSTRDMGAPSAEPAAGPTVAEADALSAG